jgi:hypothetical protein
MHARRAIFVLPGIAGVRFAVAIRRGPQGSTARVPSDRQPVDERLAELLAGGSRLRTRH